MSELLFWAKIPTPLVLKSTSLSIGAENLSVQAKQLDLAAIQAGHAPLMAAYRNVREQIAHWLEAST